VGDTVTLMTTTTTGMLNAVNVRFWSRPYRSRKLDRVSSIWPAIVAAAVLNTTSVEKVVVFLQRTEETEPGRGGDAAALCASGKP